jgi:hypothetical protein
MRMAQKFPCIGALGLLGFLASCSDPVPPASQGSASIHYNAPTPAAQMMMKMCSAGTHWAHAPSTFNSEQFTTGTNRSDDVVVDGELGRKFSCSVKANGDKFVVNGEMSVPAFDKDNKPLPVNTLIRINIPTIGKDDSAAVGSLVTSDNETVSSYQSTECTFSVKADATTNKKLAVAEGKIWGSVNCQDLQDKGSTSSSCTIDIGYFILENCDQ